MARMTKKLRNEIQSAIDDLQKTRDYLDREDTGIVRIHKLQGNKAPGYFYSELYKDMEMTHPFEKWVGSHLCYLDNAIKRLTEILDE